MRSSGGGGCPPVCEETVRGLDIRLDHDCRARLDAVIKGTGLSASGIVRNMIDQAYEDVLRKGRQSAFERWISLNTETPPDPTELSRGLEGAHAPGDLYWRHVTGGRGQLTAELP